MGLSSKKTKTTSSSTSTGTATTTPNVPDWILKPYQTQATNVGQFQTANPMDYAPQSTPALDKVWSDAGALKSADFGGARGLLDGVDYNLDGAKASDFMGAYRDLFSKDVIDPVLADYDVEAGKTRAAQAASGAMNGAFRGSRFGLREAATEGELARGRAATLGGLLTNAANFALTGAQGDAGRRQSAMEGNRSARFTGTGLLADLASRGSADQRATLDAQGKFASQEADLQNKVRQFPLEYQQAINGLLAGLNPELFTGRTTNSTETGSGTQTSKTSGGFLGNYLLALAAGGK